MIRIVKNPDVKAENQCDHCDNMTYFSDEDDDFVSNYTITYKILFHNDLDIILCDACLKELRDEINKILK